MWKKSHVRVLEAGEPRRAVVGVKRKARKNNVGQEEGVYLVLRVCRACNHRGTAKRPSTPSHSASRHSIFFSPRPLRSPSVPGHHFSRGPTALSHREIVSLFLLLPFLFLASRRCAHSIIIIGSRSWTVDAALPFRFHSFSCSFPSFMIVYLRISRPNSVALHYRLINEAELRTQRDVCQLFR